MALGAGRGDILRLILGHGLKLALAGVGIGLAISFLVTDSLSGFLFGVSPLDPLAFGLGVAVLLLAGVAASYPTARRSARVDPVAALRSE